MLRKHETVCAVLECRIVDLDPDLGGMSQMTAFVMRFSMIVIYMLTAAPVVGAAEPLSSMQASGAGADLWIVRRDGDDRILLHRRRDDPPKMVRQAGVLTGPVCPSGLAAGIHRVWIIQENRTVWLVRHERHRASGSIRYFEPAMQPMLPTGMVLRDSAAARRHLWVLTTVAAPDRPLAQGAEEADPGSREPGTEVFDLGVQDRLMVLDGTRWATAALPADWPHGAPAQLVVTDGGERGEPRLIAQPGGKQSQGALHVYRRHGQSWHRWEMAWPDGEPSSYFEAALVDAQMLLAVSGSGLTRSKIRLFLARDQLSPLGVVQLQSATDVWGMTASGERVTLVGLGAGLLQWAQMDLQGRLAIAPTGLEIRHVLDIGRATDFVLWMGTLVAATLIMVLFWKRDPQSTRVDLPSTMVLADLARRFAASAIDLAPCIIAAIAIFDIDMKQLISRWPGHAGSLLRMAPSGMVIVTFVCYTLVSELITARTVGKALLGLRVTDLSGARPKWKQTLLRNLLKMLDLIAPPLLILPLAGAQKQRLGDMVARTVVVRQSGGPDDGVAGDDSNADGGVDSQNKAARG